MTPGTKATNKTAANLPKIHQNKNRKNLKIGA
jgi:hypothetical protein